MAVSSTSATSTTPDAPEAPNASSSPGPRESKRPPSKPASAALIAACRKDYLAGKREEERRPPSPYRYAPLDWERAAGSRRDAR